MKRAFPVVYLLSLVAFLGFPLLSLAVEIENPLEYDTFQELLDAILHNFFYFFAPSIAVVMFVIAGFMFVTSAGDPGRVKKAKDLALWTAIGLAIILLASGLIKVIQSIIGVTPQ